MKTISDHIERVKVQPHHIRKQIAFFSAAGITALVAVVWFVSSISSGVFAIHGGSSFASSAEQRSVVVVDGSGAEKPSGASGVAGVGAASLQSSANAPAHIEIVDTGTASSMQKHAEQTTIPF